jgi:large subunit ribosomal protein L4
MEAVVLNTDGKETKKKVSLADSIFGADPNDHAIYLDVKQYLANQRQGTHKSKERAEIAGTTKKLKKQKGTGGARAGSMKSPVFIGGGRVFGPRPRDYSFKLNKKLKVVARLSALSSMAKDNKIALVENLSMDNAKTKDFVSILSSLKFSDKKTLLVTGDMNRNVVLSARNLPRVKVAVATTLATYDILNAETLLLTEDSIKAFEQLYSNK